MSHSALSALVAIEWSPACYDGHLVRPLSVMAALSSSRSTQNDILYRELSALCPVILLTIVIVTLSARVFILLTHQDYHEKIDQDLGHSLMIPTWSRQAAHSLQWVLQSSGQGEIAETVPDGQRVDDFWLSSSLRWPEICPRGQLMPPRTRWVSDCDHLAPGWLVDWSPCSHHRSSVRILRKPSECLAVSWPGRLGTEGGSGLCWWLGEHLTRGERRGGETTECSSSSKEAGTLLTCQAFLSQHTHTLLLSSCLCWHVSLQPELSTMSTQDWIAKST